MSLGFVLWVSVGCWGKTTRGHLPRDFSIYHVFLAVVGKTQLAAKKLCSFSSWNVPAFWGHHRLIYLAENNKIL